MQSKNIQHSALRTLFDRRLNEISKKRKQKEIGIHINSITINVGVAVYTIQWYKRLRQKSEGSLELYRKHHISICLSYT